MPSHKRHGPHRGGHSQPPPQPDVAAESAAAEHAAADGKRLNITDLKEMTIQHLTQVAKDLEVAGAAVVATKIDKLARGERIRALRELESVFENSVLPVSAVTGEGLDQLWTLIDRLKSSG